jgi:hypothetical protein
VSDWSEQEADNPLLADLRNFYKVDKWTKDDSRVERVLYAGNSRGAQEIFANAARHRSGIRPTIRQRTRVLQQAVPMSSPMECPSRLAGVKKFAAFVLVAALLTQPSYGQALPESPRQKAQEERKKADEKANDEAYKAMIKRTPDSDKKVDPWGGLRAAPGK